MFAQRPLCKVFFFHLPSDICSVLRPGGLATKRLQDRVKIHIFVWGNPKIKATMSTYSALKIGYLFNTFDGECF